MTRRIARLYREAYSGLPREVWLLSLVAFINRSGTMVAPFLALYLTGERGLTTGQAGMLIALHGAGGVAGTYLGGVLCDRLAPRRVQLASLVLSGLVFFVLGGLRRPLAIAGTLVLLGAVGEAFRPANATALARWSGPGSRTRAFTLRRLAINLGLTFGPAVGGFLALVSYDWLFWADGGTCLLAAAALAALLPDEPRRQGAEESRGTTPAATGGGSPWRDGPFLVFLALTGGACMIVFQFVGTYPLTLRDLYGFAESHIGLLLAVNTVTIVAFEMVLVHGLRRRDPLRVLAAGACLIGGGFALLPFGSTFAFAALTVVVWTAGEMLTFPLAEGFAAERAEGARTGSYLGLFATTFGLSFVIAQALGMQVYERLGPQVLWLGCGALGAAAGAGFLALAAWLRRTSGTPPETPPPVG